MYQIFFFFADGVRLRDEHRRRDQRSYSSRRSSTDSSEEGINLNIRDLKVRIGITQWEKNDKCVYEWLKVDFRLLGKQYSR